MIEPCLTKDAKCHPLCDRQMLRKVTLVMNIITALLFSYVRFRKEVVWQTRLLFYSFREFNKVKDEEDDILIYEYNTFENKPGLDDNIGNILHY